MQTEYEIKILGIDTAKIKVALKDAGFSEPVVLQFRRYVYELATSDTAWVRLRTDGTLTTVTYKNFVSNSVDGVQELEIVVDSFEKTHELLTLLGYTYKTYQENKRTLYKNNEVEICIDEWPHIEPYLEIEAGDEATVNTYIQRLNLNDFEKSSEPTSYIYEKQGLDINSYKELVF